MDTKDTKEPKFASTLEWLNFRVEAYLKKNPDLSPAGFGWASIRDTSLVDRLRAGKDVTTRNLDKLVRYMGNPNHKGKDNGNKIESKAKGKKIKQKDYEEIQSSKSAR